MLNLPSINT